MSRGRRATASVILAVSSCRIAWALGLLPESASWSMASWSDSGAASCRGVLSTLPAVRPAEQGNPPQPGGELGHGFPLKAGETALYVHQGILDHVRGIDLGLNVLALKSLYHRTGRA